MILKKYFKKNLFIEFVSNIYCFFSSNIENIFFRKNIVNKKLLIDGFNMYFNIHDFEIKKYKTEKINSNKYLSKFIFSEKDIRDIIYQIFVKNDLCNLIYSETGYKYSIDFCTAYETRHIDMDDQKYRWFANHWHRDKPFSKNTLKIIIPMETITESHGGIEIKKKKNDVDFFKMVSKTRDLLAFFPNRCYHKAGNPDSKLIRKQIMFQLNPSNEWKMNEKISNRQYFTEPKFPLLTYLFDKKKKLNELI